MTGSSWEGGNGYRAYPFADDSAMAVGALAVPNDAILDASVTAPAAPVRLMAVAGYGTGVTFTFGYDGGAFSVSVAVADLPAAVRGSDAAAAWEFVFGTGCLALAVEADSGDGPYLAASAVAVPARGSVTSIIATGGAVNGDVPVVPGYNCAVSVALGVLSFSAYVGAGEGPYCPENPETSAVLRFNGAAPDASGNVGLRGGPGIEVIPDPVGSAIAVRATRQAARMFNCGGA